MVAMVEHTEGEDGDQMLGVGMRVLTGLEYIITHRRVWMSILMEGVVIGLVTWAIMAWVLASGGPDHFWMVSAGVLAALFVWGFTTNILRVFDRSMMVMICVVGGAALGAIVGAYMGSIIMAMEVVILMFLILSVIEPLAGAVFGVIYKLREGDKEAQVQYGTDEDRTRFILMGETLRKFRDNPIGLILLSAGAIIGSFYTIMAVILFRGVSTIDILIVIGLMVWVIYWSYERRMEVAYTGAVLAALVMMVAGVMDTRVFGIFVGSIIGACIGGISSMIWSRRQETADVEKLSHTLTYLTSVGERRR